jgi:hypothetical protein
MNIEVKGEYKYVCRGKELEICDYCSAKFSCFTSRTDTILDFNYTGAEQNGIIRHRLPSLVKFLFNNNLNDIVFIRGGDVLYKDKLLISGGWDGDFSD